jgi:hypothetical protein
VLIDQWDSEITKENSGTVRRWGSERWYGRTVVHYVSWVMGKWGRRSMGVLVSDMATILSIPKARTMWCGNLKGLSQKRGRAKSAENLGAFPIKTDLSINTTVSQVNLAGQSL